MICLLAYYIEYIYNNASVDILTLSYTLGLKYYSTFKRALNQHFN